MSTDNIDLIYLKSPKSHPSYEQVKDAFLQSRNYTHKKIKIFTDKLSDPLKTDMIKVLNNPKIAHSFEQIVFKFIISACVDLKSENDLISSTLYSAYLGNIHTLITDHVIDNKFDEDRRLVDQIPVGEVCYLEFILSLLETANNDPVCIQRIREFYYKTFEVLYWEEKCHVGTISEYKDSDLDLISQKCAPIKAIMYLPIKLTDNLSIEQKIYQVIDNLSLGSLLLDDYHDWEEDLIRQRYTYPLTLALKRLGIDNAAQIDVHDDKFISQVKAAMFMSEVSIKVFDVILKRLRSAYSIIKELMPISALLIQVQLKTLEEEMIKVIKTQRSALHK